MLASTALQSKNFDYLPQIDNTRGIARSNLVEYFASQIQIREQHVPVPYAPANSEIEQSSAEPQAIDPDLPRSVIKLPNFKPLEDRPDECFAALQEWEGVVVGISQSTFNAILTDVTGNSATFEEFAEFELGDLDEKQRQSLTTGAIFRWAVGYSRKKTGTQKKASVIYFRKSLPQKHEAFQMPIFETI